MGAAESTAEVSDPFAGLDIMGAELTAKIRYRFAGLGIMGPASLTVKIRDRSTQINDSLWELYAPPDGEVTMDIVFFHGLQLGAFEDAFWKTWTVRGSNVTKDGLSEEIWPRKWLSKKPGFSQARMLSVSYNSSLKRVYGQLRMYSLAENLLTDVILGNARIGQNRPVILVGHSWGGLVIKQLVLSAIHRRSILHASSHPSLEDIDKITDFLGNIRGVFYYATPHTGSRLADLGRKLLPGASPILKFLGTLNEDTSIINSDFEQQRKIPAAAVAEGLDTPYGLPLFGFKGRVVESESARDGVDAYYMDTTANHFDVCKADGPDSAVITKLTEFISQYLSRNDSETQLSDLPTRSSQAGTSNESSQDVSSIEKPIFSFFVAMIGGFFVNRISNWAANNSGVHISNWAANNSGVTPFLAYILFFGLLCVIAVVRWCSHLKRLQEYSLRRRIQGTQMTPQGTQMTTLPG